MARQLLGHHGRIQVAAHHAGFAPATTSAAAPQSPLAGAFDGRGAALNPGRWNKAGVAVVYTAESRSLASLEVLAHTEDIQLLAAIRWATIPVYIDEPFIEIADPLPDDWRQLPTPPSARELGSRWVAQSRSAVLRVPSIVVDGEFNYLLNPRHPDFARLELGEPRAFSFDPRLSHAPQSL